MMSKENVVKRQCVTKDRISEIPEVILHNILSILDTKEACRTSVLSKMWYGVWSSIPVLNFQSRYFEEYEDDDDDGDDTIERFVGFVDKTMERYLMQNYQITKIHLVFPEFDEELESMIDKWIKIAVQNQVQEFLISIPIDNTLDYRVPEILLRAKSLKVLKLVNVVLPYYESTNLLSLECLTIYLGTVDKDMLQRIISFCPLVELEIMNGGLEISLPWVRKLNEGAECFDEGTMQSNFKVSPLRKFVYHGLRRDTSWPWNINAGALKNLRKLEITSHTITDDIVYELVHGLVALENLDLSLCSMLSFIKISSISLKKLRLSSNLGLMTATIDAPNLLEFWFNGKVETSLSLIKVQDQCNAHFFQSVESIPELGFVKLKKFLTESNIFKFLVMDLSDSDKIVVEVDQLRHVESDPPYKIREVKLLNTDIWTFAEYSPTAFLDGLFWSCHPDVLSVTANFENYNVKSIMKDLKVKVKSWKYPLKSIAVEGVDCSRLLSESSKLEIRFRLSWLSV